MSLDESDFVATLRGPTVLVDCLASSFLSVFTRERNSVMVALRCRVTSFRVVLIDLRTPARYLMPRLCSFQFVLFWHFDLQRLFRMNSQYIAQHSSPPGPMTRRLLRRSAHYKADLYYLVSPEFIKHCNKCGAPGNHYMACGRCLDVYYCVRVRGLSLVAYYIMYITGNGLPEVRLEGPSTDLRRRG